MTKLRMPPNCVDVTSEYVGTTITLVGCSTSDKQFVHELRKKIAAQKEMEAERENPASNGDHEKLPQSMISLPRADEPGGGTRGCAVIQPIP